MSQGRVVFATFGVAVLAWVFTPPNAYSNRLVKIKPEDQQIDNAQYDDYLDHWWSDGQPLHSLESARVPYFTNVLKQYRTNSGQVWEVLDMGCGGGLLSEPLAQTGLFKMHGIDISESSIDIAKKHAAKMNVGNIEYSVSSVYDTPFPDESFDAVISSDVMEHLNDLPLFIKEVNRVLKPGGVFVFDTINRTWLSWVLAIQILQQGLRIVPVDTHDWRMLITPDEMTELFEQVSFESDSSSWKGMGPVGLHSPSKWNFQYGLPGLFATAFQVGTNDLMYLSYLGYATKPKGNRVNSNSHKNSNSNKI